MTQKAYDDGDDRWDVQFRCDGCGAEDWDVWDDNPVTWYYQVGEVDGPDYCPECVARLGIRPGRSKPKATLTDEEEEEAARGSAEADDAQAAWEKANPE